MFNLKVIFFLFHCKGSFALYYLYVTIRQNIHRLVVSWVYCKPITFTKTKILLVGQNFFDQLVIRNFNQPKTN